MALAPRVVLVHRRTELQELNARHGTLQQAAFYLAGRLQTLEVVEERDNATDSALDAVHAATPVDWRRGMVERSDLSRFLWAPEDIVVVVGQDGLVANVAKYLDGQPVIGINPNPARNPGVLVPHPPSAVEALIELAATPAVAQHIEARTMVRISTDDGQDLTALNEVFVGHPSHQTARYTVALPGGREERQASSGVIVSSGTGATGWGRSIWQQSASTIELPLPAERRLAWFVREAWPSPATGTDLTSGEITDGQLRLTVESDRLVAFGDGIESDSLSLAFGQEVQIGVAAKQLNLVK